MAQMPGAGPITPPHDIVGLTPYKLPWSYIALSILGLAVLFGVGFWLIKKIRREKQIEAARPVDPEQVLLDRLYRLKPSEPFTTAAREDFFFELSMILREFVEIKTGIAVTDMTTPEIMGRLTPWVGKPGFNLNSEELTRLGLFLEKADSIKFAHAESGIVEAEQARDRVFDLVRTLLGRMLE